MSKHYEERYVRTYGTGDYDYRPRRRSSSRSRTYEDSNGGYARQRYSRSNSGSSISSVSDYEYRGFVATNDRPLVRVPRDVIRAPTPPPVIQRVVERAPTPEPDIVERVIVRPQPQQLIERIIERPNTPPPKIIDKEITEPAPPPIVRTRVVKVDSSRAHVRQPAYTTYTTPIVQRPITTTYARPAPALSTYGYTEVPYTDYINYDRSYSTYSTTELAPTTAYVQTAPSAVATAIPTVMQIPTATYNQQPQIQTYPAGATYQTTSTYPAAASAYGYSAYPGYSYGYRPVAYNAMLPQANVPNATNTTNVYQRQPIQQNPGY